MVESRRATRGGVLPRCRFHRGRRAGARSRRCVPRAFPKTAGAARVRRCPEREKARGVVGSVREDPQQTKESFLALDLVDDHEPLQRFERELGIGERRLVRRVFEVEEGDRLPLAADQGAGERRLSDLPRADETDDRKHPQQVPDGCFVSDTREHGW